MSRKALKYDIPNFPVEAFMDADRLVRAVVLSNGRGAPIHFPRLVTHKRDTFDSDLPEYLKTAGDGLDGQARGRGSQAPFDMWINPKLDTSTAIFHETLLHELCHGYVGTDHGHERNWRQFFSRAIWHYNELVSPVSLSPGKRVEAMLKTYTRRTKSEQDSDLGIRLAGDKILFQRDTKAEKGRIYDLFNRMTHKET